MHLFYTPDISGKQHLLDEQESRHAVKVLRLQKGEEVVLVDGRGKCYDARVEDPAVKACLLTIMSSRQQPSSMPYSLHIAMSPTKNSDRFEWFLEKATEMGITTITPLICHRSERHRMKVERLERILISAMKQSLRAHLPLLNSAMPFNDFIGQSREGLKAIAHCLPTERVSLRELGRQEEYTILIGPEGDFNEEELNLALEAGYRALHLGESRLRTETAGVHVCSALRAMYS